MDECRIRLEGRLEVLEHVCREGRLALHKLREGELVNLCDALRGLRCRSTQEAEAKAVGLAAPTTAVTTVLVELRTLRESLPALIRRRVRTLLLPEDGSLEALAARLVAEPIRHATRLEPPEQTSLGERIVFGLAGALIAATQVALFFDTTVALFLAVLTAGVAFVFVCSSTDLLRPVPLILTRTRLIVGGRAYPLDGMRSMISQPRNLASLQILNEDSTRISFFKSPPWLEHELCARGLPYRD